MTKDKQKTENL